MKCPYCGSEFEGELQYCPNCKQPLSRARGAFDYGDDLPRREEIEPRNRQQRWLFSIVSILCCIILAFGVYKVFFWASNYRLNRLYTRGEYTPTVNQVAMEDGRAGHTIVFYGEDGKEIELQRGRTLIILMGYNDPNAEVRYE